MGDQDPAPEAAAPAAVEPRVAVPQGELAGKAETDAAFAAAFEEIDQGQPGDEPAPTPSADAGEEGAPAAKGEVDGDEPAGKAGAAPKADDEAYEKALLALRFSGVPSAIIKNASRDELIAWGTEAAARRAKTEAALEERAVRIRELEEGKKAPAAEPATTQAAPDWTPHLKVLAEKLNLTPEDALEAFGPLLDAVAQQAEAKFEGRLSPIEKTSQDAVAAEGRRQISEQVRRLSDSHPKLKTDQDLVQKLNAKALALWKSGEYHDAESVYDDASRLVLGAPTANLAAKRRNGAMAPPADRSEDRAMSSDDAFNEALDRIEAGDKRGAMRAGRQVVWGRQANR